MDLLKVYVDNFESKSAFKTILLDDTMTVDNLITTCMKRFGLENGDPKNYYVSLALDLMKMKLNRNDLVKTAFSKYISVLEQGTGKVYLSKEMWTAKVDSKSVTNESLESQKRLSRRVSAMEATTKSKTDMTKDAFDTALVGIYDKKYSQKLDSALKNIQEYQSQYSNLESNLQKKLSTGGKMRTKQQLDEALSFNIHPAEDVKENLELVKVLRKNLEAILLISIKMCQ